MKSPLDLATHRQPETGSGKTMKHRNNSFQAKFFNIEFQFLQIAFFRISYC